MSLSAAVRNWRSGEYRFLWWPVRVRFYGRRMATHFFDWHGWSVGAERCSLPWPFRNVFGQTFHAAWGRVQIQMGHGRERQFVVTAEDVARAVCPPTPSPERTKP